VDQDRRSPRQHIVRVEGADGEVVRGAALMEVTHPADDDRRTVRLTELCARREVVGIGPAVVGGVPEPISILRCWRVDHYCKIPNIA
jgi:hypothetical protein